MTGTYVDSRTGLRMCSRCHTPREAYFPNGAEILGRRTHPCMCRCQQERQGEQAREEAARRQAEQVARLRREAFREIPAGAWVFDAVPMTPALDKARRYAARWTEMQARGIGLLLFGSVGTGKSYAAGCIANALVNQGHSVGFVGLSDLVSRMQGLCGREREGYLTTLLAPELLILDDLGAERSTSFGREQVFDVVNKRTLSQKPLIVTTNIPLKVMQQAQDLQDRRIYDRILEACVPIRFEGESFRRAHAAANLRTAEALLRE